MMVRLLALLLATPLLAAQPLTIEDYATMPSVSDPRLSPDGSQIAFVVTRADMDESRYQSDVWLAAADGSGAFSLAHGESNDTQPRWSPDGSRIAFRSSRGGSTQIWIIAPDGGEAVPLTDHETTVGDFAWSPDGTKIAFVASDPEPDALARLRRERDDARVVLRGEDDEHLWVIDVEERTERRVTSGDLTVAEFSWSPDGERFVLALAPGPEPGESYNTDIYTVPLAGGEPELLLGRTGTDDEPQYSPDGKWIAFVTGRGEVDWAADQHLAVISAGGGAPRVISGDYDRFVDDFTWAADSKSIYFGGSWNLRGHLFRVGADGRGFTNLSQRHGVASDAHFLPSRDRVAFVWQSLTDPPEIHVSPISRFAPRAITEINAFYRDRTLGETSVVRWTNPSDGLEIEGLLTLPIGYEPGMRVPLLLFVHGGPASHFSEQYLGYLGHVYPPHVFAARGYAVLRANPRGSGAYGSTFKSANRADWGGGDFADLMAGVDMLVERGIADPERLGIMGWSYGGFMAAWAITQTDRFAAASIGAPVVHLASMEGTSDIPGFIASYFGASPWEAGDLHRERSPLTHVANAETPALIQHGMWDDRVPLSQGRMYHQALLDVGVPSVLVVYPRTPHTAREPRLRMDVMKRNVWWFDQWIRDDERSYEEYWDATR